MLRLLSLISQYGRVSTYNNKKKHSLKLSAVNREHEASLNVHISLQFVLPEFWKICNCCCQKLRGWYWRKEGGDHVHCVSSSRVWWAGNTGYALSLPHLSVFLHLHYSPLIESGFKGVSLMNNARALESNYANDNFFKLTFSWPWVIKALLSVDTDMCCRQVNSATWGSRWRRLQIISETERVKIKWTNEVREREDWATRWKEKHTKNRNRVFCGKVYKSFWRNRRKREGRTRDRPTDNWRV